jgi:hypothetical protein
MPYVHRSPRSRCWDRRAQDLDYYGPSRHDHIPSIFHGVANGHFAVLYSHLFFRPVPARLFADSRLVVPKDLGRR